MRRRLMPKPPLLIATPAAADGQRIGLMGGSFNPPHQGHLTVAETALTRLGLDRIWWMATPGNPLKPQAGLAPLAERLAAIEKLTGGDRRHVATGFEAELGSAYTVDTLAFLIRRFPRTRFIWVMGADNLATFHRWRRWREISGLVAIAVVDRPCWHLRALSSPVAGALARRRVGDAAVARLADRRPPAWAMLTTRLSALSSTELRAGRTTAGTRTDSA